MSEKDKDIKDVKHAEKKDIKVEEKPVAPEPKVAIPSEKAGAAGQAK